MYLPSKEKFRCEVLSWNRIVKDSKRLSWIIKDSGYCPDIVVAIGRGGYVPARIICDYLFLRDLTTIKVEHWGGAAIETGEAVIKFPLCADIKDKRVLLIDDITDTGDTLKVSLEYLKGFSPAIIKTAVLMHKTCSKIEPDFFVSRIVKWRWVIFPWHIWEDVSGFVKNIQESGIYTENGILIELMNRYSIRVKIDMIKEIISRCPFDPHA